MSDDKKDIAFKAQYEYHNSSIVVYQEVDMDRSYISSDAGDTHRLIMNTGKSALVAPGWRNVTFSPMVK